MKGATPIIVIVCALLSLICGVVLMPVSELLPSTLTSGSWLPGLSPVRSYDAMQAVRNIGNSFTGVLFPNAMQETGPAPAPQNGQSDDVKKAIDHPMQGGIPGEVRSYVAYAIFLSLAMIFAAIAINAVGRWDSEEKTIIPAKK
ncbi:MAG TPA: hypothetical protein V6D22_07925 [Candidatus Obscuribacterales bacterium]